MAKLTHATCYLTWHSVATLGQYVKSPTLNLGVETVDMTAMNDTAKINAATYTNWSFTATMFQDYALATVDATFAPDIGTVQTFGYRDTSAAKGPTNPEYTGLGLLTSYTPVQGSVGEPAMVQITIQSAGALTRSTA